MHSAAVDFARWAPSTGLLLFLMSILAVLLVSSPLGPGFTAFWASPLGIELAETRVRMSLLHWVNDGLLTIFFLLVGLEIKREFTVGRLANLRAAVFPIAAALGGMAVPAFLYALLIPSGPWSSGWGVPMATDTAFAVALVVMLGRRVPVELRVFLTAASIVDDIGDWQQLRLLVGLAGWTVLVHLVEITVWAVYYTGQGAMPDLDTAIYFSAVTYTTTGYGDLVLPEPWRLIGGIEALTGILMCGWTTGFFFAIVSQIFIRDAKPSPDAPDAGVS